MGRIRVLVVDDAVVVRRVVPEELNKDPDIEVVGVAANGSIGLMKLAQLGPDLLLLDVEMPVMDGLQTLAEVRRRHPKLPVIMFSTLTERGAITTLDALALGASDYATKPANVGNGAQARQLIHDELIPKIKHLIGRRPQSSPRLPAPPAAGAVPRPSSLDLGRPRPSALDLPRPRPAFRGRVEVVVIGASTGGPNALARLLPELPAKFPAPVLIVQHMPPVFTRFLADRLNGRCSLPVREAVAGARLEAGQVWLAPGDFHLGIRREGAGAATVLHQGPPENFCRPALDVLFRDAAAVFGAAVLAVVLTGMGQDGLAGCRHVRAAGGQVIVQDEASSVVWGMPGAVRRAGLADSMLPLEQIGAEVLRRMNPSTPDLVRG